MKTDVHTITVRNSRRCRSRGQDQVQEVPITENGVLKIRQLRRYLEEQEATKDKPPEERTIVDISSSIIFELVKNYELMSRSNKNMRKALDKKSKLIEGIRDDLKKKGNELESVSSFAAELTRYLTMCSFILGAFLELLDAATDYRQAVDCVDNAIAAQKPFERLSTEIDESTDLINQIIEELRESEKV